LKPGGVPPAKPPMVTPGQLHRRAELYHQLSQLLAAGMGLPQALETLHRNPPDRSARQPLARLNASLADGATFSEALAGVGSWLPSFDTALLHAGEQSGRLPACLKMLSEYYDERSRLMRQVMGDLAYPVFLFHFAILIMPFPQLFLSHNVLAYAAKTVGVLLPIYVLVFLLMYAAQGKHGENWRALIEAVLRRIPLCGAARQSLALSRLSAALEALISAGVSIIESWDLAAAASGSPALRRAVLRWKPQLLAGKTPAEAVAESPEFPELFAHTYKTGEITGKLDESLNRLRALYQEEGTRKLRTLAQWSPKIVYLAVALMIACKVISFYTGYFQGIADVIPK
jgi:type II secretory pathway component PulF